MEMNYKGGVGYPDPLPEVITSQDEYITDETVTYMQNIVKDYENKTDEKIKKEIERLESIGVALDLTQSTEKLFKQIINKLRNYLLSNETKNDKTDMKIQFYTINDPRRELTLYLYKPKLWGFKKRPRAYFDGKYLEELIKTSSFISDYYQIDGYANVILYHVISSVAHIESQNDNLFAMQNQIMMPTKKQLEELSKEASLRSKLSNLNYYELVDLIENSMREDKVISEDDIENVKSKRLSLSQR